MGNTVIGYGQRVVCLYSGASIPANEGPLEGGALVHENEAAKPTLTAKDRTWETRGGGASIHTMVSRNTGGRRVNLRPHSCANE